MLLIIKNVSLQLKVSPDKEEMIFDKVPELDIAHYSYSEVRMHIEPKEAN